jgi:osmotically-inducible protein OsmY
MRIFLTSIAICSMLSFAQTAKAQFGGSTSGFGGNSGMSSLGGSSSMGSMSSSGFGGSSSGFGSTSGSSSSSSRSSSGMFGSRQLGNSQSSRKQNTPTDMGNAGQTTGSERFMRQNRQPGQFVGSDRSDAFMGTGAATSEVQSLMGLRQARSMQQNINQILSQQMNGGGNNTKKRTIRTIKAVDFPYAGPPPAIISNELTDTLIKVDATHQIGLGSGFKVEMDGRTAILRGTVRDARAKDLAERMLLLEPGVSTVQNELNYPEVIPSANVK